MDFKSFCEKSYSNSPGSPGGRKKSVLTSSSSTVSPKSPASALRKSTLIATNSGVEPKTPASSVDIGLTGLAYTGPVNGIVINKLESAMKRSGIVGFNDTVWLSRSSGATADNTGSQTNFDRRAFAQLFISEDSPSDTVYDSIATYILCVNCFA